MSESFTETETLLSISQSEALTALTEHGGRKFSTNRSKYVIHTHTIPLATIVDQQFLLPKDHLESYFHGYQAGEKEEVHCPLRSCMYVRSDRTRSREKLKGNCPCMEIALENGSMQPLCFMVYLKSINHNLTGFESEEVSSFNIDPSEIMFCQDATGILDNCYPGLVRDRVKVTGWHHVTSKHIQKLLECLYWYRKFGKQFKAPHKVDELFRRRGERKAKHIVAQVLHTVNSLLVKKMLAFSPEIEGYESLAKKTARAFSALIDDYVDSIILTEDARIVEPTQGFYYDAKRFAGLVKANFHKEKRHDRLSWCRETFSTKAFGAFFGTELRRLHAWVESQYSSSGMDYTMSPAWIYRASVLSQARGIGYLPDAAAEFRRKAFRMTVNREVEQCDPKLLHLGYLGVQKRLRSGKLPEAVLSEDRIRTSNDKVARELFNSAMARVELPLKTSASVDTYVKDGGKLEDARRLLNKAIDNGWKIPVRDLSTHEILEYISVERSIDNDADYSRPLFWISYQLFLNHWVEKNQWSKEDYYEFLDFGRPYQPAVMDATIVHISEPGKERNLTKSHATYAWLLTPAAKLLQGVLAFLPEHRAGLLESGHEWRHQKRISALSDESGFIYDPSTGKTRDEIVHVFKDWTESTDFIRKQVGFFHLKALMDYVEFPESYGRLILKTVVEPQPVSEVTTQIIFDDGEIVEPVKWTGAIREGFMMGNPMTKVILHLLHESERAVSELFLSRRGMVFREPSKFSMTLNPARIDREKSSSERTSILTATSGLGRPAFRPGKTSV
uniref:RNA-dependent RNA polymerase n=1 Tax=Magnaporthe oryzae narnavirus 1 TaxID=2737030 RepID=A0A8E7DMF7_9VIRU|nr:RNA-dependent RNA polymerase [Magnaporthe oryzae narnavirus 1]